MVEVTVTQRDRKAAWPYAGFHCLPDSQMRERWFSGYYDNLEQGHAIRAFARHRASTVPDGEPEAWLGPIPHDGGEKPTWVPDDAIVMIAFNPREYQDRMTWKFAEKRKSPAHERDWEAATAFCIQTPLYTHPPLADHPVTINPVVDRETGNTSGNDAVVVALRAKVTQLQEALVQHNERLRSAASIARRDGRETNWLTFRGAVAYTLAEYRELVTECVDALKQGEA